MTSPERHSAQHSWRTMAAPVVALLVLTAVVIGIHCVNSTRPATDDTSAMVVISLNIAHGRSDAMHQALLSTDSIRANLQDIAACLSVMHPHVVALQEADGPSAWSGSFDHVRYLKAAAGLDHAFRGKHVSMLNLSYGTALLSDLPLTEAKSHTFAGSFPTPSKGIVWCHLKWPGRQDREVCVASVHLDFARASVRQSQVDEICQQLSQLTCPLILMGDFNCEWNSGEQTLRTITERLSLRPFAPASTDLVTFPETGRRLDWILISRELQFESCVTLPNTVSDHQPVVARVRLNETK